MSTAFIVNSRIGKKKMIAFRRSLSIHFGDKLHMVKMTAYAGHAPLLAEEAIRQGATRIVAVGGDGTVNEIVQVLGNTEIALGIVPLGSGNGLARHCRIPLQIDAAVALLVDAKVVTIDLGKANDYYFVSNTGVGFDALVCRKIKETNRRGLMMYVRYVFKQFFSYKSNFYDINIDGHEIRKKAYFLNVANGKEFGYGFKISPNASIQDQLLNLIVVEEISIFNAVAFVIDGWKGSLYRNKYVYHTIAKRIQIKSPNKMELQTDGDARDCGVFCHIFVCPNALKLLVPPNVSIL